MTDTDDARALRRALAVHEWVHKDGIEVCSKCGVIRLRSGLNDDHACREPVSRKALPEGVFHIDGMQYSYEECPKFVRRALKAEAEAAALREALRGFVDGADHTRVFLSSREKIHQHGLDLWDAAVSRARAALKETADAE